MNDNESNFGTFTDPRDGQTYKTVQIGKQVWLAENLNFNMDGKGSYCYDDDPANAKKYGRLYTWEAAKNACPPGWHLPNDEEWDELKKYVEAHNGGEGVGTSLKATRDWGYGRDTPAGTDLFGFSALPAGSRFSDGCIFGAGGGNANFWSAAETGSSYARRRNLVYRYSGFYAASSNEGCAYSVRCLKDSD